MLIYSNCVEFLGFLSTEVVVDFCLLNAYVHYIKNNIIGRNKKLVLKDAHAKAKKKVVDITWGPPKAFPKLTNISVFVEAKQPTSNDLLHS